MDVVLKYIINLHLKFIFGTQDMFMKIVQWLPLIIAFIAGSFALYQIRSNNITNSRLRWLDNLKQVITDFICEITTLQIKKGILTSFDERREKSDSISQNRTEYYNELTESLIDHLKIVESKYLLIKFAINPHEKLHKKFEDLLEQYMVLFNEIPIKNNLEDFNALNRKMDAYSETMALIARYIMKLEWEKIKRSNLSKLYYMKFGKGKILLKEALEIKLLPERQRQS